MDDFSHKKQFVFRFVLIAIIVLFLAMPFLIFQIFDPFGSRILDDGYQVTKRLVCFDEDCTFYYQPPGTFEGDVWSFAIDTDLTRHVPDNSGDCRKTVLISGDSVTFGEGVNDTDTWVNLLAKDFADERICFKNFSQWGWNVEQVRRAIFEFYPDVENVDLIIYASFVNDADPPLDILSFLETNEQPSPIYLLRLLWLIETSQRIRNLPELADVEMFETALQRMLSEGGDKIEVIEIFSRDGGRGPFYELLQIIGAPQVDVDFEPLSVFERHASPTGNQQIAEVICPIVERFLVERQVIDGNNHCSSSGTGNDQ